MPRRLLALLVAVRLAVVAAYPLLAAHRPEWTWANNDGYDTIAIHWAETGTFALEPGRPTALRLPLYPAAIALAYRGAGAAYPWVVMAAQAALSIWTGGLLFRLAAGLFGRRTAGLAAVLFIFHPHVNNFIFRCATETLFIFLVTALAHETAGFLRTRRRRHLVSAAAALGLSLLTRQTLLPLAWLGLLALAGWVVLPGRKGMGRRAGWTALAAGTVLLLLAPWLVRNRMHAGRWVLQTWVGQPLCQGIHVQDHLAEFWAGRKTLTDLDGEALARIRHLERRHFGLRPAGLRREVEADLFFRARARQLAAPTPLAGLKRMALHLPWAPVLQMTRGSTRILMICNWPLLALGLGGVLRCLRRGPPSAWNGLPVLVLFGYLWAVHAATWPQARYVLPGLVPFLAFAAYGLDGLVSAARGAARPAGR